MAEMEDDLPPEFSESVEDDAPVKPHKYKCSGIGCGYTAPEPWTNRYIGATGQLTSRCPGCGRYYPIIAPKKRKEDIVKHTLASMQNAKRAEYITTKIPELDLVLGQDFEDPTKCGFVKGGVYLVVGEKGCGKSTLLLQASDKIATERRPVLYVAGEQNDKDLAQTAQRLDIKNPHVHVEVCSDVFVVTNEIYPVLKPKVIIIDSINRVRTGHDGGPGPNVSEGSATMLTEVVEWVVSFAKEKEITIFFVGHLTKAGDTAGPEGMMHDVDCLLVLKHGWIKDPHNPEGWIEATKNIVEISIDGKNRYGDRAAVSLMEMTSRGLTPLSTAALKAVARADKNKSRGKLELVTD